MFDHLTVRASDFDASERFYATVLATLGIERTGAGGGLTRFANFVLAPADEERPPTRRLHVGFVAPSREHVHRFWEAGTAAGYRDDGPPGPRPQYAPDYYGAFLLDPDGNSAEAVHLDGAMPSGAVDHVWMRATDLEASRRFHEPVARRAGLRVQALADRLRVVSPAGGSYSVLAGSPTRHTHLALAAPERALLRDPDGNAVELVRVAR